jgi:hypothetical protein
MHVKNGSFQVTVRVSYDQKKITVTTHTWEEKNVMS